jgi:hypothetical protein
LELSINKGTLKALVAMHTGFVTLVLTADRQASPTGW